MDFQKELEKIREAKMEASKQPDLLHQMEAFLHVRRILFFFFMQLAGKCIENPVYCQVAGLTKYLGLPVFWE